MWLRKLRFNILVKILISFFIIITAVILLTLLISHQINKARKTTEIVIEGITPFIDNLHRLKSLVVESRVLIGEWVYNPSPAYAPEKEKLRSIVNRDYPILKEEIAQNIEKLKSYSEIKYDTMIMEAISTLGNTLISIDSMFQNYKEIWRNLPDMEAYEDIFKKSMSEELITSGGAIAERYKKIVNFDLEVIIKIIRQNSKRKIEEVSAQFSNTINIVFYALFSLVVISAFIAVALTFHIARPLNRITANILKLSKGVVPDVKFYTTRKDEIGELIKATSVMINSIRNQTRFANELAKGNFEVEYHPLSEEDELGYSLIKMRDALWASERYLTEKVKERTKELEEEKRKVENLYARLLESLNYARRIQLSLIPLPHELSEIIPGKITMLYLPKDVVSGDFYWMKKIGDEIYFALMDCTGHGVPGAFMTVVGINAIERTVAQLKSMGHIHTGEALRLINFIFTGMLHQPGERAEMIRDGMEGVFMSINPQKRKIYYSSARGLAVIVKKNGEAIQLPKDIYGIGPDEDPNKIFFNQHEIEYEPGDILWCFSDGYMDQLGGPKNLRFGKKNFISLLCDLAKVENSRRHEILFKTLKNWQGHTFQVDDILVMGFELN